MVQGTLGVASVPTLTAPARAPQTTWAHTGRLCSCSVPEGLQPRARQAYKLRFDRVGKAGTEFQCVFIHMHKDEGVLEAAAAARRAFGQAPSDYMPHLSLLYAKIPDKERTEIAEQLQARAHIMSLRCCTSAVLLLLAAVSGAAALLPSAVCATAVLLCEPQSCQSCCWLLLSPPSATRLKMLAATLLIETLYDHFICDMWPFKLDLQWKEQH